MTGEPAPAPAPRGPARRWARQLSLAARLNAVLIASLSLVLGATWFVLMDWVTSTQRERSVEELRRSNLQAVDMIDAYAAMLEQTADMLGGQFALSVPRPLSVRPGELGRLLDVEVPVLRAGGAVLNLDLDLVDGFTAHTGAVASILVRQGEEFVRVATSLRREEGTRALGTLLAHDHPAYARLLAGHHFTGRALLFGREYMTHYQPLLDARGELIGAAFVGVDFTESLKRLKAKVREINIGREGYLFVLDAVGEPGLTVIHPRGYEGQNVLDLRDAHGQPFIRRCSASSAGCCSTSGPTPWWGRRRRAPSWRRWPPSPAGAGWWCPRPTSTSWRPPAAPWR